MWNKFFQVIGAKYSFWGILMASFGLPLFKEYIHVMPAYGVATAYLFFHGMALMFVGHISQSEEKDQYRLTGWMFYLGTFFFSLFIYIYSFTNNWNFVYVSYVGSVLLLIGWGYLASRFWQVILDR